MSAVAIEPRDLREYEMIYILRSNTNGEEATGSRQARDSVPRRTTRMFRFGYCSRIANATMTCEVPSLLVAMSGGTCYCPATHELLPGADAENHMSALSDFRRLYPQLRTQLAVPPLVSC